MATYRNWLLGQIGRQDIVGDLAAAVHGNVNKPRASGVDGIERWIRTGSQFNLDWALKAHAAAVAAYTSEQGHVQTVVKMGEPIDPPAGTPLATVTALHGRRTEPAVITNRELLGRVSEQLDAILENQMAIMKFLGVEAPVPDFGWLASIAVYEDPAHTHDDDGTVEGCPGCMAEIDARPAQAAGEAEQPAAGGESGE